MRDELFLIAWGLAMVGGALVYAATGWAPPVLIDKTMPAASDAPQW